MTLKMKIIEAAIQKADNKKDTRKWKSKFVIFGAHERCFGTHKSLDIGNFERKKI